MQVSDFDDYKACFLAWVAEQPHGGRGQFRKLAQRLGTSSVFVSQVFRGDRNLSADQALGTAEFMALGEAEIEWFTLLVAESRAGARLRDRLQAKRAALRKDLGRLSRQISVDGAMPPEAEAIFYGHWHYSAVRLLCSLPDAGNAGAIAARLGMQEERAAEVVRFLTKYKLIKYEGEKLRIGPQVTHLDARSPFAAARQAQWRTKAFEATSRARPEDLFYTGPMSLDPRTRDEIRRKLTEAIKFATSRARASEATTLACLNVDWFEF